MGRVRYVKYFDSAYKNLLLWRISSKLPLRNSYESLILVNMSHYKVTGPDTQYLSYQVNYSEEMRQDLDQRPADNFIAIHNHPNGGTFSIMDLHVFLATTNLRAMIVLANNCREYYIMIKHNTNDNRLMVAANKLGIAMQSDKVNGHDSVARHKTLMKNLVKSNIEYKEFLF